MNFDLSEEYEAQISPILAELLAACDRLGMPIVVGIQLGAQKVADEDAYVVGMVVQAQFANLPVEALASKLTIADLVLSGNLPEATEILFNILMGDNGMVVIENGDKKTKKKKK